jgi:hypothetical protein
METINGPAMLLSPLVPSRSEDDDSGQRVPPLAASTDLRAESPTFRPVDLLATWSNLVRYLHRQS